MILITMSAPQKISTKLAFSYDNENLPSRQPGAIGQPY
jgi:hypothetical protein